MNCLPHSISPWQNCNGGLPPGPEAGEPERGVKGPRFVRSDRLKRTLRATFIGVAVNLL